MISNKTFMQIAHIVSQESYCVRRKVGSIIVKNNSIISIGYNGTPSGDENVCENDDALTKPEVLHAESNAITKLAKSTLSSEGADLYVTTAPCMECAKLIIQSGIKNVYFMEYYNNNSGLELLERLGVNVLNVNPYE
jgi:dCMP deaminase